MRKRVLHGGAHGLILQIEYRFDAKPTVLICKGCGVEFAVYTSADAFECVVKRFIDNFFNFCFVHKNHLLSTGSYHGAGGKTRARHSKKRSRLSGSGRGGRDVTTVYPIQLALVVITAVWAGLNIGHILTLWQVEAKNRNDQGNDSDK